MREVEAPSQRPVLVWERLDQIKPTPLIPVIHDYLFGETITGLIGASGCGKSFIAGHMACSIATGTYWFGQDVEPGAVFVLAGEGRAQVVKRFRGWSLHHNVPLENAPIFLADRLPPLHDQLTASGVVESIKRESDALAAKAKGVEPKLIIVDTVARAIAGADENSAADMGRLVDAFDWLKSQWRATVLPIHHTGHGQDTKTRARGSSALYAGLDGELLVASDGHQITIKATKCKDWGTPPGMVLDRRVVEVEVDGQSETTLVLVPSDGSARDTPEAVAEFRQHAATLRAQRVPIREIASRLQCSKGKVEHALRMFDRDADNYANASNGY